MSIMLKGIKIGNIIITNKKCLENATIFIEYNFIKKKIEDFEKEMERNE